MLFDTNYNIESQLVTNTFVNPDYKAMSNRKIGTEIGLFQISSEEKMLYNTREEFDKWLK